MVSFQVLYKNHNRRQNNIKKDKTGVKESYQANYLGGKKNNISQFILAC